MVPHRKRAMKRLFAIVISDGLELPGGFVAPGPKSLILYALVPADWGQGDHPDSAEDWPEGIALKREGFELICQALYGAAWRHGNDDGSRYVIRSVEARAHNRARAWVPQTSPNFQYHWFIAGADGVRVSDAAGVQQAYARDQAAG